MSIYYYLILPAFAILYLVFFLIMNKKKKEELAKWLEENPTAAKIYVKNNTKVIVNGFIKIESVDGEYPKMFNEKIKQGFYVLPGNRVIEVSYTFTRPGVMYKSVSTTYGPTKLEVEIKEKQNYSISFNGKDKDFEITEI